MYSYRFADLLTDADIAELELSNVRFDRRIIIPGAFSGTVTVTNPDIARQVKGIIPGKTVVHVYRDYEIWGTYIIWSMRVRSNNAVTTVELSGASLESWFYRRIIDLDLDYTADDQIFILADLVSNAQVGWLPYPDSANLGIFVTPGLSGVTRDRSYRVSEAASVGKRIEELANVDNGFEYMIKTYLDGDVRVREMIWGYPQLNAETKNIQFFYPGNIISYEISYDATDAATAFWARGDSVNTDTTSDSEPLMVGPEQATSYIEAGWPWLDKVVDYASVTSTTTLDQYAEWWRDNHAGIIEIPMVEINGEVGPIFHPNFLGAYATFTITDEFFPLTEEGSPTYTGEYRVVGLEVTPPQKNSTEKVRFILETDFDPTEGV